MPRQNGLLIITIVSLFYTHVIHAFDEKILFNYKGAAANLAKYTIIDGHAPGFLPALAIGQYSLYRWSEQTGDVIRTRFYGSAQSRIDVANYKKALNDFQFNMFSEAAGDGFIIGALTAIAHALLKSRKKSKENLPGTPDKVGQTPAPKAETSKNTPSTAAPLSSNKPFVNESFINTMKFVTPFLVGSIGTVLYKNKKAGKAPFFDATLHKGDNIFSSFNLYTFGRIGLSFLTSLASFYGTQYTIKGAKKWVPDWTSKGRALLNRIPRLGSNNLLSSQMQVN